MRKVNNILDIPVVPDFDDVGVFGFGANGLAAGLAIGLFDFGVDGLREK